MARSVNVLLEVDAKDGGGEKRYFDINNDGLVNMTFYRYLGDDNIKKLQVVSMVDISLFDKSGGNILSLIQQNKGKLRFKYGFNDNMSESFELNINKINSTYNNLGCMVSIGAVGKQAGIKFDAEIFPAGTIIEDIIINMANRNRWNIGESYDENNNKVYNNVWCPIPIPVQLLKEDDETDIEFIRDKLLPIANMSVTTPSKTYDKEFWDFRLFDNGANAVLYFRRYVDNSGNHSYAQRVWDYSYGDSTDSNILTFTNNINYDFLIKGLTIKVPTLLLEGLGDGEVTEESLGDLIFNKKWKIIENILNKYRLPIPNKSDFILNIETIPLEEADFENIKSLEDRIADSIKNAIMSLSSAEITVVGNPWILPTDIIDLRIYNRPDENGELKPNIISGAWKITKIRDEIGLSGFKTKLSLVRYVVDATDEEESQEDNGNYIYDNNYEVNSAYIRKASTTEFEYSDIRLDTGWYLLKFLGGSLPGVILQDLTSITTIYKNRLGSYLIPQQNEYSDGFRDYEHTPPVYSMKIYIKDGWFKIYSAGAQIFNSSLLKADYISLTKI